MGSRLVCRGGDGDKEEDHVSIEIIIRSATEMSISFTSVQECIRVQNEDRGPSDLRLVNSQQAS